MSNPNPEHATKALNPSASEVQLSQIGLFRRDLLAQINEAQRELGSTAKYRSLPVIDARVQEVLQGKRILMVDDSREVLEHWSPLLITASLGSASCLLHESQDLKQLAAVIQKRNPEILLLDYSLNGGISGANLAKLLRAVMPQMLIVGFSSSQESNSKFIASGTIYTADKSREEEALSRIVTSFEYHLKAEEKRLGPSPLFLEIEEAFNRIYGHKSYEQILKLLCAHFKPEALSELGYSSHRDLEGTIDNLTHRTFTSNVGSPFRRVLSAIEIATVLYCGERDSEGIRSGYLRAGVEHPEGVNYLSTIASLLPEKIRSVIATGTMLRAQAGGESFGLLYGNSTQERHLITPEQFIRFDGVAGEDCLYISPQGKPLFYAKSELGDGAVFFDGVRLMVHPELTSCSHPPRFYTGHYILHSNQYVIANGFLFNCERASEEINGWSQAKFSAKGELTVSDRKFVAIGRFLPSQRTVERESGMTVLKYSEFASS